MGNVFHNVASLRLWWDAAACQARQAFGSYPSRFTILPQQKTCYNTVNLFTVTGMTIRNWDKSQGDIVTSGSTQFLSGKQSTANGIYHRLRMFFGEFFLDITDGTPFFQTILGKFDRQSAEAALKQRIITSPGVVAITRFRFDSDRNTRRITVDCTVLDINNQAVQILFDEDVI